MTTVLIAKDSGAKSVGADAVAAAFEAVGADVIRTGSRGLYWLEPMAEIDGVVYGPLTPEDAAGVLADGRKRIGPLADIPEFAQQTRMLFKRVGAMDPTDIDAYRASGGEAGLNAALALPPDAVIQAIADSGLRGRGGAGFPTGIKWRTVADTPEQQKYIVCNADEGDSGTFADRMLMEGDPYLLLEGMAIAGYAVGASKGFIYLRSEYPDAAETLTNAIANAPFLDNELDSGFRFSIELRMGAGAYICGEETALLESLEGKRGLSRAKPPLPAHAGAFGQPTVVNNVLTLAAAPIILAEGAAAHHAFGTGRSRGTMPFQLAGNIKQGGLVEAPFGITLRQLIEGFGGGTRSGRPVRAVQVGGPLGAYFPESLLDTPMDYEAFAAAGGMLGHGGVVVFDDTVDLATQARFAFAFCAHESCGKCTPCRIGAQRGVEVVDKITAGDNVDANFTVLDDLLEVMRDGSLCALGGLTPTPVESALKWFRQDFDKGARQ
ncbi:MAG: formate dehydrogenase [Alphaproteobacteria bacterium]|jgi:formate dehydrogenase iron-sulfur subunit|nr:formate dehydrogenase [Alphaproteobacteria bacterium]